MRKRKGSSNNMMRDRTSVRLILFIMITILFSSCATQGLNTRITEVSGLKQELSIKGTSESVQAKDIKIIGRYYGVIEIEQIKYFMIGINSIRTGCGQNHEVILYLAARPCVAPVLKERNGNEGSGSSVVDIIFHEGAPRIYLSREKFKETFSWPGYPDRVIIYYSRGESVLTAHYRFDEDEQAIGLMQIKDDLSWECRSKIFYYTSHILYPFTCVFDVVTFPLQWLLWQIWHS